MIGGQKDDFEESSEFILKEMGIEYTILKSMRRKISFKYDRAAYKEIKNIINNAGGKVDISSEEGKGTTVSIYFPVLSPQ